jgi:hypothetical protein
MFWGLPIGVRSEPVFTAMASNIMSFERSFLINLERDRVIGIVIKSVMSFVKNIERKREVKIR